MRRSRACICARCSPRIPGARRASPRRAPVSSSTTRRTGSRTRPCACCCGSRRSAAWRSGATPCSRGEKINTTEAPRRAPRGAAGAARRPHRGRRRRRRAGRAQGAGRDGRLRHRPAQRRLHRPHRQAHPQRRQYRHRRVLPRARDGVSRAARLQRPVDDLPLRGQRRRRRLQRGDRTTWTRPRHCSSCRRRPSRRWRR